MDNPIYIVMISMELSILYFTGLLSKFLQKDVFLSLKLVFFRERSGSVVEFLIQDRGAAGSSLTAVTALWSLSKTHLS